MALYFIGADKEVLQREIMTAGAAPAAVKLCSSPNQEVQAEAADLLKVSAYLTYSGFLPFVPQSVWLGLQQPQGTRLISPGKLTWLMCLLFCC